MNEYSTPPYILYAVPAFLALIGIELLVTRIIKKDYYRLNDSINDLTLGTYSRVIGAFYAGAFFLLYVWLYENARMFDLTAGGLYTLAAIPVWIGGFLAVDMLYYWFHRTSHQVAVVWGSHEPHHSSEEYNLAVALRQGSFQGIFSYWFYLPLAFIGLHPVIFLTCSQFNTIYQFWIHTRAIDKMWAPIEWIFNTPSHHRVHHGINPKYIDKNHAGTLIIWDKLFGTFQAEEEEAVYGTVKPLASWNPVWANVQYWIGLAKKTAKTPGALNKLKVWFAKPGWQPAEMGGMRPIPEVDPATFVKYDPRIPGGSGAYVFFHFVLTIPIFVVYALLVGANVFRGRNRRRTVHPVHSVQHRHDHGRTFVHVRPGAVPQPLDGRRRAMAGLYQRHGAHAGPAAVGAGTGQRDLVHALLEERFGRGRRRGGSDGGLESSRP